MKIQTVLRISIVLALASASAHASTSNFCSQPLSTGATFEDLQEKIVRCKLATVDAVLPLLSSELLSNYVLMQHSGSLQEATAENPRAILYGDQAKLVLTFNSDSAQYGNNSIELLQFRDKTASFEFRRIEFGDQGAVVTDANPPICLSCHRQDPRPNFATYPLWPGAFGGEDDSVFRHGLAATTDSVNYDAFLDHAKKQGRYRFLSDRPSDPLPNTSLGSALQRLNFKRIARTLAETATLSSYHYALMGAVSCFYSNNHTNLTAFVPAGALASFKTTLAQIEQDTSQVNRASFLSRVKDLQSIYPKAPETSRVQEMVQDTTPDSAPLVSDLLDARLRWLIENAAQDMSDWSMVFEPVNFDFENGYVGVADLLSPMADALLTSADDQVLRLQLENSKPDERDDICGDLEKKSLAALQTQN